jgi:hypothetical protein
MATRRREFFSGGCRFAAFGPVCASFTAGGSELSLPGELRLVGSPAAEGLPPSCCSSTFAVKKLRFRGKEAEVVRWKYRCAGRGCTTRDEDKALVWMQRHIEVAIFSWDGRMLAAALAPLDPQWHRCQSIGDEGEME